MPMRMSMTDNNGLKDEHGRPVDTLVAEELVRGWQHYRACTPTLPGVTTASYDLGRQLTAELQAKELAFKKWLANEQNRSMAAMNALLPAELLNEHVRSIQAMRSARSCKGPSIRRTTRARKR